MAMKRRPTLARSPAAPVLSPSPAGGSESSDRLAGLVAALRALDSAEDTRRFLLDLCTPAELEAMADRWAVVPELAEGRAYRDIHDRTGVSVTTVGRVARCLALGSGGYRVAAERLGHLQPGAAFAAPVGDAIRDPAPSADGTH